jgi:hypothetical protein
MRHQDKGIPVYKKTDDLGSFFFYKHVIRHHIIITAAPPWDDIQDMQVQFFGTCSNFIHIRWYCRWCDVMQQWKFYFPWRFGEGLAKYLTTAEMASQLVKSSPNLFGNSFLSSGFVGKNWFIHSCCATARKFGTPAISSNSTIVGHISTFLFFSCRIKW